MKLHSLYSSSATLKAIEHLYKLTEDKVINSTSISLDDYKEVLKGTRNFTFNEAVEIVTLCPTFKGRIIYDKN